MSFPHDTERTGRRWVRRCGRAFTAELLGTALLVWLGCAALLPLTGPVPLSCPALAFGCAVLANVSAFSEASGAHMNPALTLGAVLCRRLSLPMALVYVVAQLLGATLGYYGLLATSPALLTAGLGVTLPGVGVSPLSAMFIEVVITGVLMLTVCSVWAAESVQRDPTAPLKIALVVAGLNYAASPATGAALNPARSFAPAFMQGVWTHHWVYWAGPLLGAALAVLLYRAVLTSQGFEHAATQI
ncbi:unnamed protein product [Arctia plantaginis]|uniref:Aquaporin n=1 Tax=Arctia plantaginis TaxID=874455 RepID=A0A8S1A402_ARCPL|nr:unnamed protein product [Arctia plantaginis]CAB3239360.1 unnamed protein product [Arctia plantaginis]